MAIWSIPGTKFNQDSQFGGRTLRYKTWRQVGTETIRVGDYEYPKTRAIIFSARVPANATWAKVQELADALIARSGDDHHVFIESFWESKKNPNTIWLETGS